MPEQKEDGYDEWFRKQVQKGLDEHRQGLGIPADAVEAYFEARRAASDEKIAEKKNPR